MKNLIVCLITLVSITSNAQEKEPVYSIVEERHDKSWYENQLKLWKADAENEGSPNAWYNYYVASRSLRALSDEEESQRFTETCKKISDKLMEVYPNSFEANYVAFWQSGWGSDAKKYLWKAVEINPEDSRIYDDLLIEYDLTQNASKREEIAKKMVQKNYLSPGIMNVGHNILSELDENAIAFTAGDNDTYSLWLNQFGLNYREDVTTINIYLIAEPSYRKKIFAKLGVPFKSEEELGMLETVRYIMENCKKPTYLLASVYNYFSQEISLENLYLTGLTYRYSEESIDNLSLIRRNYEKRYALDHLTHKFWTHRMDAIESNFNYFYILPLVKLYHMYGVTEELEKQKIVRTQLESISVGGEMEEKVKEMLNCTGDC